MKFITNVLFMIFAATTTTFSVNVPYSVPSTCHNKATIIPQNNCISFSVSSGTGCAWMCNYCASNLGTNNYYFTDGVCKYDQQAGGCVGNPQTGVTYTCCSA
jgi:hypothetical protein